MDEVLIALSNGDGYEWIANNYYKLSKEDLRTLLLEMIYVGENYANDFCADVVDSVKEWM